MSKKSISPESGQSTMAEGGYSDLTGAVSEDAVPLETNQLLPSAENIELVPGSTTASYQRNTRGLQAALPSGLDQLQPRQPQHLHQTGPTDSRQGQGQSPLTSGTAVCPSSAHQTRGLDVPPAASPTTSGVSSHDDQSTLADDVMKGVSKVVGKIISENIPSSQTPSSLSSELSSLERGVNSLSLDLDDKEIEEYRHKFPKGLKIDYYDAVILYQEDDKKLVQRFLKRVNTEVMLNKVEKPRVALFDDMVPDTGMTNVGQLDLILPYCTYVFLYVTKGFCTDGWTEFSSQTCLMNAIDTPESRWSVVPIFTEPKRQPTFRIPPSIRSLKGIQYWSDDKFYVDSLRKLLEDKLHIRKKKEVEHKTERKIWIIEEKGREKREAEERRQKELQALEKERIVQQQHRSILKARQTEFLRSGQQPDLRRCEIRDPKDFLSNYGYKDSPSGNAHMEHYLNVTYQHHSRISHDSNPNVMKESGSAPSSLGKQGMAEFPFLQHSFSDPANTFGSIPSNPSISEFANISDHKSTDSGGKFYLGEQGSGGDPRFPATAGPHDPNVTHLYGNPIICSPYPGHMLHGAAPHAGPPTSTATLPPHSAVGHGMPHSSGPVGYSMPFSQQPYSRGVYLGAGHPSAQHTGFRSLPGHIGGGERSMYGGHQERGGVQLPTPTAGAVQASKESGIARDVEKAMSAVDRGLQNAAVGAGEEAGVPGSQHTEGTGQAPAATSRGQADGKDESFPHQKNSDHTSKSLSGNDDLVEDLPPETRTFHGQGYPATSGFPAVGHAGQQKFSEAVMEPVLSGQGPAHYSGARARVHPDNGGDSQYNPHIPNTAGAGMGRFMRPVVPPPSASPHYPYAFPYMPPPGQYQYSGHGYSPSPQQYHQQAYAGYPPWQLPAGMQPGYYANPQLHPNHPQLYAGQEPPAVHHHHYHTPPVEQVPTTTINYIATADNVMMANTITTKSHRSRIPEESMPTEHEAGNDDRHTYQAPMDEQYHGSENRLGGQNLENPQSSSHTSPSSAHTSHATVQSSRSGLTQNVSGDNRSHQSSAPAGGGGGQMHFAELPPQHQHHESPSAFDEFGSMGPLSGRWDQSYRHQQLEQGHTANVEQSHESIEQQQLEQSHHSYEQQRQTVCKAFITGSDDEGEGGTNVK